MDSAIMTQQSKAFRAKYQPKTAEDYRGDLKIKVIETMEFPSIHGAEPYIDNMLRQGYAIERVKHTFGYSVVVFRVSK